MSRNRKERRAKKKAEIADGLLLVKESEAAEDKAPVIEIDSMDDLPTLTELSEEEMAALMEGVPDVALEDDHYAEVEVDVPAPVQKGIETPDAETLKKYYGDSVETEEVSPTTWSELDATRAAQDKAFKVMGVTYDTERLIRNALRNPDMTPNEKAAAISSVASGMATRTQGILKGTGEKMEKEYDLELLEAEVILAKDHPSTAELITGLIQKAKLTSAARDKLPESAFALPAKRKYPIQDAAHVRNALARAAQQIKEGGEGADDARAALPRIKAAAKKMGIGMKKELEENAILILKDAEDHWRWVGAASNNFKDRAGEIIYKEAHEEYVEWLEKNMDVAPAFCSWHIPGSARTYPVDYAAFENGFLVLSGKLTDSEAGALMTVQKEIDLGMSIHGFAFARDPNDLRGVKKYRLFEVSDLPVDKAANPFTSIETLAKEVGTMDKKEYLTKMMGKERADALWERLAATETELQKAGIEQKELPAEPADPKTAPLAPELETIIRAATDNTLKELDAEGLKTFAATVSAELEKIPVLEAIVKDMADKLEVQSKSVDDQLAERIAAPASKRMPWSTTRPSNSQDNLIKEDSPEDKKLADSAPGIPDDYWLSKATNTTPVQVS